MKVVFVLFLAFAIAYPSQAFLINTIQNAVNSVTGTVNNVVNSVTGTVSNTVSTIQSGINAANFVGQIVWDNALGPSWEMFLNNGADFIDNYFGNILNAVGKKRESEVRLQLSLVQQAFNQQANQLKTYFKAMLNQFIAETLQIAQNSIITILLGQTTINDVFETVLGKFKSYIQQAVQFSINSLTAELHGLGPEVSEAVTFVQQQLQLAGVMFENELNQISSFAINAVNGALAFVYNNFEDLISYYRSKVESFVSDANKIIGASLIGFLFGVITVDQVLASIVQKGKEYLVEMVQYTTVYATQKFQALLTQYKPIIQQALALVQQFDLSNINVSQIQQLAQQILGPMSIMMPGIALPPFLG